MTEADYATQLRIDEAISHIKAFNEAGFKESINFTEFAKTGAILHYEAAKSLGNAKQISIFALSIGIKDLSGALKSNAFETTDEPLLINSIRMKAEMIILISQMPDE